LADAHLDLGEVLDRNLFGHAGVAAGVAGAAGALAGFGVADAEFSSSFAIASILSIASLWSTLG